MSDELKKEQGESLKIMKDWLDSLEAANQFAPIIQQAYEQKVWEAQLLDSMPDAATEISHDELLGIYSRERTYWENNLSPIPFYDDVSLSSGTALTLASASASYQFASRAGDLNDLTTQYWSQTYVAQYMDIQRKQQRISFVKNALSRLNPDRAKEFEESVNTYRAASTGWSERASAGIALRNVLEHFKGDLFDKAINRPKEQKINWSIMASRLAVNGAGSPENQALDAEEVTWKSLHKRLTEVAKNLQAGAATNLEFIFTEWVDHLNKVLLLIDSKQYSNLP